MTHYKTLFTFLVGLLFLNSHVRAQDSLAVLHDWFQFTDAPNALYHHISDEAYALIQRRNETISGLKTLPDWQNRQQYIHQTLLDLVGPFPEKTPLNPKVMGTVKKDGYRVEHIVFESQPGLYVTAAMFIPDAITKRHPGPAIIYCLGHTDMSFRYETYQYVILNLVSNGFTVFTFDPVGQGERLEYFDPKIGKSSIGSSTDEHSYAGIQAFITGSSEAHYEIWDGIRAVDYLLTRPEVDPARIGITGRSGGGTQTAYIAAMEDRIYAAAPECYITSFTRLLQSIGPQDAEQNIHHQILQGIDHADYLEVRAPKPTLMITTTRDFFSIQGARETAKEVSRIYEAYGKPENFHMVEDDAEHESTLKNREAMYAFFRRTLGNPGPAVDQKVQTLDPRELQITPTGQASTSFEKNETVFTLNRAQAVKATTNAHAGDKISDAYFAKVLASARELSGYREPVEVADPVFTGRLQADGYAIEKYFVKGEGEGDYVIPYLKFIPEKPNSNGLLYLHPAGKSAEAASGGEIEWFVRQGFTVLAPDLIGTGEMGPGAFQGDSYINKVSYNVWFASILVGRSIVGIRAADVVRLVQLLKEAGVREIYGVARDEMAPVLLHAAAFDPGITRVALVEPLCSYASMVMNRSYDPHFIFGAVAGALGHYDLPDLAASLAPRKLMMAGVVDGAGGQDHADDIKEATTFVHDVFSQREGDSQFLLSEAVPQNPEDLFSDWIK